MVKKRKDSFFGLHFDFHAKPDTCPDPIGATLCEEDIRRICREVRPDFIQIDCKGHPGWASYPSAVGNAMPGFVGDPLELWRRVTGEEGVALYLHYSGVVDVRYCIEHPRQCTMESDGTRKPWATRTNGTYADDVLIPQLCEVAGKYGADGAWIDGDCWGSQPDFDPDTVREFEQVTGINLNGHLPAKKEDPYYNEYREFCRELFRRYVRHYTDAVHAKYPDFQIASNWAYTDHMPEPVSANVDFLSGDLDPNNSFVSARYAGRAIAQQNRTWDLMSWNFRSNGTVAGHIIKHPVQILQEAAAVISVGGGFQNYITQYRDGSPRMPEILPMKQLGDFMRERKPYCFRGHAMHQVALILSTYDRHLESGSLFSRNGNGKIMGMTSLLCDSGHSTEIVSEHVFEGHEDDYPVLAVPELFAGLDEKTGRGLLDYASRGGSLLLIGQNTCRFFASLGLPVRVSEPVTTSFFTLDGCSYGRVYDACSVQASGAETSASMAEDYRSDASPLAIVLPYGKGKIALAAFDLGSAYLHGAQYQHIRLIRDLLDRLYDPYVRVLGADGTPEITVLTKDGRTLIQLVNASGQHADPTYATGERIPSCRDILLSVRESDPSLNFILQPEGRRIPAKFKNGRTELCVDHVDIHSILEITAD